MDGEDQVGGKTDGRTADRRGRASCRQTITLPAPASKNLPLFMGKNDKFKAPSTKARVLKGDQG